MSDPYASREITVRDTLSHRSGLGLGAGDLLFWPDTTVSRDQVVAAARSIPPASSFRSRYAYNNLMFVIAGQVIASVTGQTCASREHQAQLRWLRSRLEPAGLSRPQDRVAHRRPHRHGHARHAGALLTIPDALVTFALDETGKVDTLRMVPTSDLADFSFDYRDLLFRPVRPRK